MGEKSSTMPSMVGRGQFYCFALGLIRDRPTNDEEAKFGFRWRMGVGGMNRIRTKPNGNKREFRSD